MKLSIVVPVYNAEKYLRECIKSVLNQTNSNWELVLVDDGSTDNSFTICDEFAQQYSDKVFVYHKENEGQFLTRQYGITKCTGDYIGFLDADDLLETHFVQTLCVAVENYNYVDAVCFNFSQFDDSGSRNVRQFENCFFADKENLEYMYKRIIDGTLTGSMWSKIFKSELIKSVGINSEIVSEKRFGEDAFQSFSILFNAKSVLLLEDVLYCYRINPAGASLGFAEKEFDYFNIKYVFCILEKFLIQNYPENVDLLKRLYARNFNETVYHILKFYRSAQTKLRKKQVVAYSWQTFLLDETLNNLRGNEYVRKSYLKVWKVFSKKAHLEIYIREKFKKIIGW